MLEVSDLEIKEPQQPSIPRIEGHAPPKPDCALSRLFTRPGRLISPHCEPATEVAIFVREASLKSKLQFIRCDKMPQIRLVLPEIYPSNDVSVKKAIKNEAKRGSMTTKEIFKCTRRLGKRILGQGIKSPLEMGAEPAS